MSLTRTVLNSLLALLAGITLTASSLFGQQYVPVNFPGATNTSVNGMDRNNSQIFVGNYTDDGGVEHGFIFTGGSFLTLDYPGNNITYPHGVNDAGQVVGQYYDADEVSHGFLWNNGTFTTLDVSGGLSTFASGINNEGSIVGGYTDTDGAGHGFIFSGGNFSTNDVPGAAYTELDGINNQGDIAGTFTDAIGLHAFLLTSSGMTTIDAPNSTDTLAQDLNDLDEVVGGYVQSGQSNFQGFIYSAGVITTVVYPGGLDTLLTSLSDAGVLAGDYDSTEASGAFIRTNGPFAYVANQGSNTVTVIDIPSGAPVATIPVGSQPHGVAISPDGKQVYVSNTLDNDVSVIDTATNTVIATIPVQSGPRVLVFTPDGSSVYVANRDSNSVSVINTSSQTVTANVPVQNHPVSVSMALTSNGTFAYVANAVSNTVSVIAVGPTPTVVQTINVGTSPNAVRVAPNSSVAYVANWGSNNVSVISVANNTVTATIPVGMNPYAIAFSPDSSTAYVSNANSNTVSVIDTASNTVVNTIAGFNTPESVALTADGSAGYVSNSGGTTVSVFATSTNTITGTISVGTSPANIRIASNPQTSLTIMHPLSPTQPTQFDYGTHNYAVQYPPGAQFSNIVMSVTAVQITQAQFQQRMAGTQFANAICIVYAGAGGNCLDYQVTCSQNNSPVACPSEPQPTIAVQTNFSTAQTIVNPGFLTTPIGQNSWQNIFTSYFDPGVRGKTNGFSEFVAVDLGTTNQQGGATMSLLAPLRTSDSRVFNAGTPIPVTFSLTSIASPSQHVTDAMAGLTVVMVSDASGNPQSNVVVDMQNAFQYQSTGSDYLYQMNTTGYAAGTYILTVYGDAFAAQQAQFTIQTPGTSCIVASPSPIDFGNVQLQRRKKRVLTLQNNCTMKVEIGEASFTDVTGNPADFSIREFCLNEKLRPGQSCTIAVKFSPDALVTGTATLNIVTSAPGSPLQVPITAAGIK